MSRINFFNFSAIALVCTAGVYTGTKFFEPIVVERLRLDGNLRDDIEVPKYDENGELIVAEPQQLPPKPSEFLTDKQAASSNQEQSDASK
ncbi:hypothetical protein WICANDRAFT_60714 [Wickerhamomyces anomalus NRRL Y-366-8]|uniref:Protein ECM19 n=1 Tax=Wickerhamomyces anomalus (strain ATCC 58044 / CBS 1984 / NCYC 433 / NRRL Y-366-8) TaxID=683960 RepID=A0A1E3PB64_WICAA|nr:uncharacterized protein WICANDRAFT_60714 [Wickerhamomyces anomalus NRRL Y-366-8]ODQ62656.1 hypothetical protein WICANDRAFT_60714 [Wickerhamomyces anomalus NRRL Y-366-8]